MIVSYKNTDWFYSVEGEGEPIIFLHGGFDSSDNYTRLSAELSDNFKFIAVDRRGHGRTADTAVAFDYALMAEELNDVIEKMKLPKFHLIGYSDGANIGLHFASCFPDKVKTLISISGNYKGLSGMSQDWLEMVSALSLDFIQTCMPEVIEQYFELNPKPDLETYISKTKKLWSNDVAVSAERLSAIKVPTLLVSGDRDIVLPCQLAEMKSLIPNSSVLVLPYCGHFIFQDFAWSSTAVTAAKIFEIFISSHFTEHKVDFI